MWERKLKRLEGIWDCTPSDMLSFKCPSKRKNPCKVRNKIYTSFDVVVGRLGGVWITYLLGGMKIDWCSII